MMTKPRGGDTQRTTFWQLICFNTDTAVDRANNRRFTLWCIAWAIAIIAATWVVNYFEALPGALAWLIALSPNVFAVGSLIAYLRLLRMTDELQRKIHIEGLAVGFGIGWIFAIAYLMLQSVGVPALPVTAMILVMTGGWMLGTMLAVRHYQ